MLVTIFNEPVSKVIKKYENTYLVENNKGERRLMHASDYDKDYKRNKLAPSWGKQSFDLDYCKAQGQEIIKNKIYYSKQTSRWWLPCGK